MSDNKTRIEEQLVISKARQEIAEILSKYDLKIESGRVIFPREDMEILRSHILFSKFIEFWERYSIFIKSIVIFLASYPPLILFLMNFGVVSYDLFHLFTLGSLFFLFVGLGFFLERMESNFGYWSGEFQKDSDRKIQYGWTFIPADLKSFVQFK
ncbi:hypothetical protein [Pseudovibrio sp. SPO723]|uniref:hypothetical protein n=1 Tax=Nesiotobacter zosterae TaxID=392721 RepID=UPI0029C225DC|nr:hypothetical protein [Pseudovibrio sp. SPO723]MDX5591975.1 hypothetical protein [Pseudovibrio sp. SPO723]